MELKEIDNALEIQKLLQEQVGSGGKHQIWLKNKGELRSDTIAPQKVDLVSKSFFVEVSDSDSKEKERNFSLFEGIEAKIYLTGVNIIFFSEILNYDHSTKTLQLALPEVAFFSERRSEERKRPMGMAKIRLPIRGELSKGLIKDVLDLSSGGLSFILAKKDFFPFEKGDEVPRPFELTYQGRTFLLHADVVHIVKIKPFVLANVPYGDRLVSLHFTEVDQLALKRWQSFWKALA